MAKNPKEDLFADSTMTFRGSTASPIGMLLPCSQGAISPSMSLVRNGFVNGPTYDTKAAASRRRYSAGDSRKSGRTGSPSSSIPTKMSPRLTRQPQKKNSKQR